MFVSRVAKIIVTAWISRFIMFCNFSSTSSPECSGNPILLSSCEQTDINIVLTETGIVPSLENYDNQYYNKIICSVHFNNILRQNQLRGRRTLCQLPPFISAHPDIDHSDGDGHGGHQGNKARKCNGRGLSVNDVRTVKKNFGVVLPVFTRMYLFENVCKLGSQHIYIV